MITLYLAIKPNLVIDLVLRADGFFIVVLSSIVIIACLVMRNLLAKSFPRCVANASTFIIKTFNCTFAGSVMKRLCNSSSCFFVFLPVQTTTFFSTCSGQCVLISLIHVPLTPLGHITNNPFM